MWELVLRKGGGSSSKILQWVLREGVRRWNQRTRYKGEAMWSQVLGWEIGLCVSQ